MTANFFEFQERLRAARSPAQSAARPVGAEPVSLSVTELTAKISKVINSGLPQSLLVRGEVSNCKPSRSSGHLYFTLKDADACIDCVMYRGEASRLKFETTDGMEVIAEGRVGVYPVRGRYQLYINTLRPMGQGPLEVAFQQVRKRLEGEGLFAADRKKPIPAYPRRIAIVTSREAAALQDILKVLRRFSWLRVALYPVPVQGDGSAQKIAAAIAHLNSASNAGRPVEIILLARGGGSLEDLWSFNEEVVARAIAASKIAVVTGIGHEVDVSIADLVADHHAHTPTEAAQVITAHWRGAKELLGRTAGQLARAIRSATSDALQRLRVIERHEAFRRPADRVHMLRQLLDERQRALAAGQDRLLRERRDRLQSASTRIERFLPSVLRRFGELLNLRRQQLDQRLLQRLRAAQQRVNRSAALLQDSHPRVQTRLGSQRLLSAENRLRCAAANHLQTRRLHLEGISRELEAISPQSVLRRGYTITTRKKDGSPLRSAAGIKPGDKLVTRFADGQVESVAEDSTQLSLFE